MKKESNMDVMIFRFACAIAFVLFAAAVVRPSMADEPLVDEATVIQANNQFAVDLYGLLGKEKQDENLFFSPMSVSISLVMAAAGAKGETYGEMLSTLHLSEIGNELDRAHPIYRELLKRWNADDKNRGYRLRVANRLWGQKGFSFLDDYLSLTEGEYGAKLGIVDFEHETEAARKEINAWVEKQTAEKIKNLLPPGAIDGSTRLVLTNAIYFKGDWASPFKKEMTREEKFIPLSGSQVKVPMMHAKKHCRYADDDSMQVLELPYKGHELSMLIFLPKKLDGLPELEKSLTAAKVGEVRGNLAGREVDISLPKFKLEDSFSLSKALTALGMKSAFTGGADFSNIDGRRDLFISAVLHKAFVDVNEMGTEAAAATGTGMAMSARPDPTPPAVFRADHPFLFAICDNPSGGILFVGRLAKPSEPGNNE
jgi:serpin B